MKKQKQEIEKISVENIERLVKTMEEALQKDLDFSSKMLIYDQANKLFEKIKYDNQLLNIFYNRLSQIILPLYYLKNKNELAEKIKKIK